MIPPMESRSASIPDLSSDDQAPVMTPQPERHQQGKFCKDETNFLSRHLPAYEALCHRLAEKATGPKSRGSIKGLKKEWVLTKVFPEFVKEFSSDQDAGPQLQSLQAKMLRWFSNRSPVRNMGSDSTPLTTATSMATSMRPRATNGPSIFAEDHKRTITELMAEEKEKEGGIPKQVNLIRYRKIKQELYDQLTDEDRRAYEAKAVEQNRARKALPERSENFKNQENMINGVVKALSSLIGWDWGQYGEAAFFVQAAFRNADNNLKTFNVSVTPNSKTTSFSSTLPDYKNVFRAPFREWAENALPVHSPHLEGSPDIGNQKYAIELQEDGLPHLPIFDLDLVAPSDARLMLKTYIEFTWKFAIQQSAIQDEVTVPWDLLDTAALRRKLIVNPESISHMKTLDPIRMTPRDVYDILDLLLKGQTSGVRPLQFSIPDDFDFDFDANLQDDDISELTDPQTPKPKPRTASPLDIHNAATERRTALPRNVGINYTIADLDNDASDTSLAYRTAGSEPHTTLSRNMSIDGATETDNDTSSLHGPSIQSPSKGPDGAKLHTASPREAGVNNATVGDRSVQFPSRAERNTDSDPHTAIIPHLQESPLSAPAAASPVADLPFKSSPPSSEFIIEAAIQNVARAGYLSIIPHATAIKPDQTPSQQSVIVKTTNSETKKRTEMETELEENSEKQTKKRAKVIVPAREQSLRLKDCNYKNKHVTVRPR